MWNARLDEAQAGIKISGRNINNFRYADDTTLMGESEEELKSLLMKVKEESEKPGLKLNIRKTKIMASSPITSWEIDWETTETVRDFIFGGSKITTDGDCSHEIKRHFAPWKKSYEQSRQCIKKQIHYFANKGPSSQSYGFSSGHVWMWELDYKESWALRNWCFWTVVLEKTLESPWTARRSNQSILKEISPEVIWRTDVEAGTPILYPPESKNWLIWTDPDAGKDWRWEEKGTIEDEVVGWHHWFNEFE